MIPGGGSDIVLCGGQRLLGFIHKRFVGALVDIMSHDKARMDHQSFRIRSKASLCGTHNPTKRLSLANTDQCNA